MAASSVDRQGRRRSFTWFGVVALLLLVAYARACGGPFQFDDHIVITAHEEGHLSSVAGFVGFARARVLPFATLALNYWVGGESPFGYHAVNVAIHLLATFLVFALALALCLTPRLRDTELAAARLPFAVAAAVLFACHPIQVQAVTYVIQRMSSLAATFYVGSVLLYVRARNAQLATGPGQPLPAFVGSALCALAAFLSKENTASLPLAILLTEWAFYGAKGVAKQVVRLTPYVLLALVIPVLWSLLAFNPARFQVSGSPVDRLIGLVRLLGFRANPAGDISPLDYFFTQCVVIPRYLRLVALPWGFNVDHDIALERALSPAVAGGLAFLAALMAFGLYAVRRWPVTGFGILWCFVALSVESSFLPIRDAMVEHRMYLAMPGIALAAGSGFAYVFRWRRSLAVAAGAVAVVALVTLTRVRNEVWRSPVSLWSDAVAGSPNNPRAHVNLGLALLTSGQPKEAVAQYCRALALDPGNRQARVNLDAALEDQAEARLEADEDVDFEGLPTGADGSVGIEPPDPCRNR